MRMICRVVFLLIFSVVCWAQDQKSLLTIDQKIKAFEDHEEQMQSFHQAREADLDEVLEKRKQRQSVREKELQKYLDEKRKQKQVKPEDTPAYEDYLLKKWEWKLSLDKAADEAIKLKQALKAGKKERVFELREYALQDTEKNRIPFNKRKLLGGKSGGGSSFGGGFGGGSGGNPPPYIPPPPIEDIPDFDNDIPPPPPPPPPPMGGGGFDELEPMPIPPPPPPME